jgi:hypothetical protein
MRFTRSFNLMPLQFLTRRTLLMMVGATVSLHAAEPVSPNSSANLDAKRDVASKTGFLTDTNHAFSMLFIVGDSTVHNPGRGEETKAIFHPLT